MLPLHSLILGKVKKLLNDTNIGILCIDGPTAAGKTILAEELAVILTKELSIKVDSSFLAYVPKDEIGLSEDENQKVEKLLEFLDDLEDVQNVFSNQSLGKS